MELNEFAIIPNRDEITQLEEKYINQHKITQYRLMDEAADFLADALLGEYEDKLTEFHIFCGEGNNGGDGITLASKLLEEGREVKVYLIGDGHYQDKVYSSTLNTIDISLIIAIKSKEDLPIQVDGVIIDCLFGNGLSRNPERIFADTISFINAQMNEVVAVDLPSGIAANGLVFESVVKATKTLTFEPKKLPFYLPEHQDLIGETISLDLGLDNAMCNARFGCTTRQSINSLLRQRNPHSHKGNYGHIGIYAGSPGMYGAAVLATLGAGRSGCGKISVGIPLAYENVIYQHAPYAMIFNRIQDYDGSQSYDCMAIGPGIGQDQIETNAVIEIVHNFKGTLVLDADALNIMAKATSLQWLKSNCILTPHPKEFDRLFGNHGSTLARIEKAQAISISYKCTIVLKGHHACVVTSRGKVVFNTTGNAGMAKAGSGDVLTGLIGGLCARGYTADEACILGLYFHGEAGDSVSKVKGMESMTSLDVAQSILIK